MDNTSGSTVFRRYHPKPDGVNIVGLNDDLVEDGIFQIWGWTWDKAGNRPTETQTPAGGSTTTRTYSYVSRTNRLAAITQGGKTLRAFTYDAVGNMSKDARGVDTDYGYDNAGRLRTVTVASSLKGTYTYDGLDRPAIRTLTNQTPSGTTHFIHMLGGGGAFDELAPGLGEPSGGTSAGGLLRPCSRPLH
jgi:hypothetical protein